MLAQTFRPLSQNSSQVAQVEQLIDTLILFNFDLYYLSGIRGVRVPHTLSLSCWDCDSSH